MRLAIGIFVFYLYLNLVVAIDAGPLDATVKCAIRFQSHLILYGRKYKCTQIIIQKYII